MTKSKRERIIWIVLFSWVVEGVFAMYQEVSLTEVSAMFAALTLFVGNYLISESKRKSSKGGFANSKREKITYIIFLLWLIADTAGIYFRTDLVALSVYFSAMVGFVVPFVWGETVRENKDK